MKQAKRTLLTFLIGLTVTLIFGQNLPNIPQPTQFQPNILNNLPANTNVVTNPMDIFFGTDEQQRIKKQNEQLIREAELYELQRLETQKQLYADLKMQQMSFGLPSKSHIAETQFYRNAFKQLSEMNPEDFSVKKATFIIENAFYEEQKDYEEFNQIVKQTGDFLREKMDELGYNKNSNLAKNFILFQFFADTLEIKSKNLKHLPFEYDFEDYMGRDDFTKFL